MTSEQPFQARPIETRFVQLWKRLESAPKKRRDPFRTPSVATVNAQGVPENRTVVLRAANYNLRSLSIFTDSAALKCRAISLTPHAAFCFWDPKSRVQIRMVGRATLHTGEAVHADWARQQSGAKKLYQVSPEPGHFIDHPSALTFDAPARFSRLDCEVQTVDILWLTTPHHERMGASWRNDEWSLNWLVP